MTIELLIDIIKKYGLVFLAVTIIIAPLAWKVSSSYFSERIEAQRAQVALLQEKITVLEEKLKQAPLINLPQNAKHKDADIVNDDPAINSNKLNHPIPLLANKTLLRFIGFYPFGSLKFNPSQDKSAFTISGENNGYSGYTKATDIDIGNKTKLVVQIKNSNRSEFSNMNKMLKVIAGSGDLALQTTAGDYLSDDPEFIIKADGMVEYAIPTTLIKNGRLEKIGFVFGPGIIKDIEIEAWFQ